MNRRSFLKCGSTLTSYSLLSQFSLLGLTKALADSTTENHFFVLLQVDGGMDVTLGLDPRTHIDGSDQEDVFLEYTENDIIQAGKIRLGPAAAALKAHSSDLVVINGINMRREAGHEASRDYMASGKGDGMTALLPIEIAAITKTGPLGLLINRSVTSGKRNLVMTQTQQLINPSKVNQDLMALMSLTTSPKRKTTSFYSALSGFLSSQKPQEFFDASLAKYKAEYGDIPNSNSDTVIAALSFKAGLSQQAILQISNSGEGVNFELDTHSNHEGRHLNSQKIVWDRVAETFSLFKSIEYQGKTLFDHTTFMILSEFSRTPFLNNASGKDHNPYTNSILLAGKGLIGNQVVGGSHIIKRNESKSGNAQHISSPMDFSNGDLVKNKDLATPDVGLIFPENVARTISKIFGDPKGFSSVDLNSIRIIPGITKNT